jgi:hypothetical protein
MQSRHSKTDTARVSRLDILISIAVLFVVLAMRIRALIK